jgi:DNA primase
MRKKTTILKDVLGIPHQSSNELLFYCPFCKHHKKKLSINLEKLVYKCWICDSKGGVSYLVKRFGSIDDRHDWALLTQEVDFSSIDSIFNQPQEKPTFVKLPSEYICLANDQNHYSTKEAITYLWSRGVTQQQILFYKIGCCLGGKYKNRIVIPSFDDNGECNYFVARSYKKDWMSYKNPPASKNIIFNELMIDWEKPITLVEGVFDALKIKNSVPILGSTLKESTKLFKKIVETQTQIYIGLDQDALSKSLKIISILLEYGLEVNRLDTSQIEDIGSISQATAEKLKLESKRINLESIFNIYWSINEL